jgi:hypothetical protein
MASMTEHDDVLPSYPSQSTIDTVLFTTSTVFLDFPAQANIPATALLIRGRI